MYIATYLPSFVSLGPPDRVLCRTFIFIINLTFQQNAKFKKLNYKKTRMGKLFVTGARKNCAIYAIHANYANYAN
jgi:hypothetical protein